MHSSTLRNFRIQGIKTNKYDTKRIQYLGTAIRQILTMAYRLESLTVEELGCSIDEPPFIFVHSLFEHSLSRRHIRHMTLSDLRAEYHSLVNCIRSQFSSLEHVSLQFIELTDGTWSSVLTRLRSTKFPALKIFELQECTAQEPQKNIEGIMLVQDYVGRKTNDNPCVI